MSSHHIVRDEQEPALLVLHADWLKNETLASLLEWSPTIIVPASEVETLAMLGIKPDIVVANAEEKANMEKEWESFAPLILLEQKETENSTVTALHFLLANKYKAVNIISFPIDQNRSELELFFDHMDIVFYGPGSRWLWLRNGAYTKWHQSSTRLTLHTKLAVEKFQLKGLKVTITKPGETLELEVENDAMVSIEAKCAFVLEEPI